LAEMHAAVLKMFYWGINHYHIGNEDERHRAVLAVWFKNDWFSYFSIPDFFHVGNV